MRGLTDKERRVVETWRDDTFEEDDDICYQMLARGLIRIMRQSCDCGAYPSECCSCVTYYYEFEATPYGLLALRLDALARETVSV